MSIWQIVRFVLLLGTLIALLALCARGLSELRTRDWRAGYDAGFEDLVGAYYVRDERCACWKQTRPMPVPGFKDAEDF